MCQTAVLNFFSLGGKIQNIDLTHFWKNFLRLSHLYKIFFLKFCSKSTKNSSWKKLAGILNWIEFNQMVQLLTKLSNIKKIGFLCLFTASSLGILAAYRRRQRAQALLDNLVVISTFQRTDERLHQFLEEGKYSSISYLY